MAKSYKLRGSSPFFLSAEALGSRYDSRHTLRNAPGDRWRVFGSTADQRNNPRRGFSMSASKRLLGPVLGG